MTYSEILIARVSALCKRRGIAYNKLAAMCGLNQSTIDNIVRGASKDPRIQTLHHIALGLNMTLAEFLDYPELNDYSFEEEDPE
ncbi:MAG: helix-turn-helix transcriptional regulator [Candidatus Limiplasma sp.]|nr:helix-turn-helix transcriptional regulator [Candidatus Limiplasma sp.]